MGTASDLGPMSNVKASDVAAMAMAAEPSSNTQSTEYEGLLEMHERQELAANPAPPTPEVDLEAARAPAEETARKEPRAPLTEEEMRAKRVTPMDNIRALALCLLILQNAAIQAVSTHPQAAQLHEIAPRMLAFVNIFVGMTRLLAVPLLFFVSGFASQCAMAVHDRSPIRFLVRKTWRSALTIGLFQGMAHLSKLVHPLLHEVDTTTPPYYTSKEGIQALLNGPTAYVVAILALDYIYAISRWVVLVIYGHTAPTHFINSPKRYKAMKYTLFLGVEVWAIIFSAVVGRYPLSAGVQRWIYALNSAELHFPLLYLGAYIAGVKLIAYHKFLFPKPPKTTLTRSTAAAITIFVRIFISVLCLSLMYNNYPQTMPPFLDVRRRPALTLIPAGMRSLPEEGIDFMYGVWVGYTLMVIPDALVAAFWSIRPLATTWGKFSRHAHIQVYVQLLFIVGNSVSLFDNLFVRWVYLALGTIYCAHYFGVLGVMVGRVMKRGWNALRGCRHTTVEAQEGGISL